MRGLNKILILLLGLISYSDLFGAKVNLYINRGMLISALDDTLPCLAFNTTSTFSTYNTVIKALENESIELNIFNNDSISHGIKALIDNNLSSFQLVEPKTNINLILKYSTEGIYPIFDSLDFPKNYYLGLATMICVRKKITDYEYFWNLKEHQIAYSKKVNKKEKVDWEIYDPEFFTINAASFPMVHDDPTAKVYGKVGDTIRIYILNSGISLHSIHFHGFHCKVIQAKNNFFTNTSKDTFPINSLETLLLEMIPDKKGEYSVHDHNLMATTSKLRHPSGMMLIMLIE